MNKTNDKKVCSFFVSDYHFEMITLPYIEKEIENNKKIIILTDKDLTPTINVLLERMNLSNEKKSKIRKIDWNINDSEKINQIKNENNEDEIIFIKGRKDYVINMRKNVDYCAGNKQIECIDCYDLNELGDEVSDIANNYGEVLNTFGKAII